MNFIHASMHLCIFTALHHLSKDWILSVKHSSNVYWHIKIKLRVLLSYMDILPLVFLCLHQGPLRWNGHWFSLFTSRPSPMEWSLIFLFLHQGPLRWNGHWFSYVYIKALSDGMIIDFLSLYQGPLRWNGHWFSFFTSRPSPMEWSLIFFLYIKALSDGTVIDLPSSHQGPLRWNGYWFLCHNMILSFRMVEFVFFFWSWPFSLNWSLYMLVLFFPLFL